MAKRKARRRNSKFQALPINVTMTLGALASGVLTSSNLTQLGVTRYRVVAVDIIWSMSDKTADEGPIEVGISNGDLSNTELGEALDASPTSMADIVARERARRPVRRSGKFSAAATAEVLNDGKKIRTKLNTVLDEGIELEAWARNGDAATLTTGTIIEIEGTVYGYWI